METAGRALAGNGCDGGVAVNNVAWLIGCINNGCGRVRGGSGGGAAVCEERMSVNLKVFKCYASGNIAGI